MVSVNNKRPHTTICTVSSSGTVPAAGERLPRIGLSGPGGNEPVPHLSVSIKLRKPTFSLSAAFSIEEPCVTAVWGRSGCGKTTLLRSIAGIERIDEGTITVNETCWLDTGKRQVLPPHKRHVGYVFQDADLFPHLDVRKNLQYGLKRARQGTHRFSEDLVVELLDLRTLLDRSPLTLSGGQKQRVAIGRTLLAQPELLLLDEPVSALDSTSRVQILTLLQSIKQTLSLPMLYVTHQVDEVARLADRVCIMENGRIVDQGPKVVMLRKIYRKVHADPSGPRSSPSGRHFHNGCDCPYDLMFNRDSAVDEDWLDADEF